MTAPTPVQVQVATDALRTEAGTWDEQSAVLGGLARAVADTALDRAEAGVCQLIVGAYQDVVAVMGQRCREGTGAMTTVAGTLRAVAGRYDAEDAAGEHRLRQLY